MDTATIDQAYSQLQTEFQNVARAIQGLAQKLQGAADSGDQNAREWMLDLMGVALAYQQPMYPQQQRGGMFGNFLSGGFGQAIELGAGSALARS